MNQTDNNDTFATIVADALRRDAERAPEPTETWSEADLIPVVSMVDRRPRRLALAAGLTAAAAALLGIAIIAPSPFSSTDTANEAVEWIPAGTEFPTTDLGPATMTWGGPSVEALTRAIGVPGHPDHIVSRSMSYNNEATAEEFYCTWENGGGGCRPASLAASWSISHSSSVDNGDADTDLWLIEGLPDEVAFVSYDTADQQLWQRPIFGFAAFPYLSSNPVVIGYDRTGTEVARYSEAKHFELVQGYVAPLQAQLSDAEQLELWELTGSSMTECLAAAGGQVGAGGIATFADDVDQVAVWDACVPQVEATVAARVAEIGPEMREFTAAPADNQDGTLTTITVPQD